MKSKAHHKKCTELGIIPVPTTTDDSQIDEEALAKQVRFVQVTKMYRVPTSNWKEFVIDSFEGSNPLFLVIIYKICTIQVRGMKVNKTANFRDQTSKILRHLTEI